MELEPRGPQRQSVFAAGCWHTPHPCSQPVYCCVLSSLCLWNRRGGLQTNAGHSRERGLGFPALLAGSLEHQ